MDVSSEDKTEVFVILILRKLQRSYFLWRKRPPIVPEVDSSITEVVLSLYTIRHVLDGVNINKAARLR